MKAPRWRCGDPTCWAHKWQIVRAVGDPMQVAMDALERHYEREHQEGGVSWEPGT